MILADRIFKFLLLLLVLWSMLACNDENSSAAMYYRIKPQLFLVKISVFGELKAVKSTPIISPPEIQGSQTISWLAQENTVVKKGDVVLKMDTARIREDVDSESINLQKVKLDITNKKDSLNLEAGDLEKQLKVIDIEKKLAEVYQARDTQIFSRNKIIEDEVNLELIEEKLMFLANRKDQFKEKSLAEILLLQAKQKIIQTRIDQLNSTLSALEIKAPQDGLLVFVANWRGEKPDIGRSIWGGMKLMELPDLSLMEAKVYVLEAEANGLKAGLPVRIYLNANPKKLFMGKIKQIDNVAKAIAYNSPLKYFEIIIEFEQTDKTCMYPGSQVKGEVIVHQLKDCITVPNQSIFFDQGNSFVYIKKSGKIEKQAVTLGIRSISRTLIETGLKENDLILLNETM